jgi:hypothetical protein
MAVGALDVTAERETYISFSYTILSSQASILIRKGKSQQNFFQVSHYYWLLLVLAICVN